MRQTDRCTCVLACAYNARECSAKHRHELWFTFNQSAYWEKKVEGKPAKHIILGWLRYYWVHQQGRVRGRKKCDCGGTQNGHAIPRSRGVVGARSARMGCAASCERPTIRVLMTKNATNIRHSCTQPNTQSMGSCEMKGPHKIFTVWKKTENVWVL